MCSRQLVVTFTALIGAAVLFGLSATVQSAPDEKQDKPYTPTIAAASDEAAAAAKRIRVPKGLQVSLWAAEPMLANPVSFCVDEKNRFYVVETFRLHVGVTDIREHMDWLDDELACRTVADRVAMYRKYLGKEFSKLEVEHDRIRLLEDRSGRGRADTATVFADGFHHAEEGLGAGVVARDGDVWFTCIPNLWLLRDTAGKGKATVRKTLHSGYGVHLGFIGHDLHGLRFGPDGKLYFSIGDRGLHVESGGRTVSCPDTGAVLRCNPDGSDLELVATGLRNPQELVFDQYGNLFTGDNNADHGDLARWVYVVEGGDSGWRIGYQHMRNPVALGPWNAERLWQPAWDGQAAYIVPPIANVADGPSGVTYEPGASQLPASYRDHFFLCDFRGEAGQSGVRSFAVKKKGASFELVDQHECIWSVLATDVDFGMDGALYVSDWVEGWTKPNKGRLYKIHSPSRAKDPVVQEVRKVMAEGMHRRSLDELATLMDHADMRVRQAAQFELARRGTEAMPFLSAMARSERSQLARLHAVWGLGQVGRQSPAAYAPVMELLADADAEVRAQAAKVLGDGRVTAALDPLLKLLRAPETRVRFFAAISVGKICQSKGSGVSGQRSDVKAVAAVLQMIRENADKDPYLRHAGMMALVGIGDRNAFKAAAKDGAAALRLAVLLALRRLESPEVAEFLNDSDPRLVVEAARAIYDVPILAALPRLAALIQCSGMSEPLGYRVLNANYRLGRPENATAIAAFAARNDVAESLRLEGLQELEEWGKPSGRDRIVGLWRPLEQRPASVAVDALRSSLGGIFSGSDRIRQEGARVAATLGMKEIGPILLDMVITKSQPVPVRTEALHALATLHDPKLDQAIKAALADSHAQVRAEGRRLLARLEPVKAIGELQRALEHGEPIERQSALAALGEMTGPAAEGALSRWLDKLLAGQVSLESRLDLLEAALRHPTREIKAKLARYDESRPKDDPLGNYRETLAGGNREAGRRVFFHKPEVACVRCHKIKGEGGEVGPDLTTIGAREKREYLLESIVDPNRQIAKGFETTVLELKSGVVHVGILKSEDEKQVKLMTAEGTTVAVSKDQIESRTRGKSAMPEDIINNLTKTELRDLVEFLAGLK
jgi:quinoprotein glucose dehydrogenase